MPESLNLDETLRRKDFDDPDELAEIAKALTRNVAEVVPGDMLIRQPELPAEVQRERGQRIMTILGEEADKARMVLRDEELAPYWAEYLRYVDRGDQDAMAVFDQQHPPGIKLAKHAWFDAIAASILKGWPIEFATGDIVWGSRHAEPWARGLEMARIMHTLAAHVPNIRIVSLINDYEAPPQMSPDLFIVRGAQLLARAGIVHSQDVLGKNVALLRATEQPSKLEHFLDCLAEAGHGTLRKRESAFEFYLPPTTPLPHRHFNADTSELIGGDFCTSCQPIFRLGPEYIKSITHPLSFLNQKHSGINRPLFHMSIDDTNYTRTLLRSADLIGEELWHTIGLGLDAGDEKIANYAFCRLMSIEIGRYLNSLNKYNDWHEMDSYEYAERNFLHIHDEDRELIPKAVRALGQIGLQPETAEQTVDVGPGPNLYSAMLAAPYAKGPIVLREFSPSNRQFLQSLLDGTIEPTFNHDMWPQFEELMVEAGGNLYQGVMNKALEKSQVEAGSIYDLPREKFDWVSAFCVLESIVDNKLAFWQLWKIVGQSLRKPNPEDPSDRGGVFVGAFMVGSEGWPAGSAHFPAVNLSLEQMEAACRDANLEFLSLPIGEDENTQRMREGYQGMALIIAWRKPPLGGDIKAKAHLVQPKNPPEGLFNS